MASDEYDKIHAWRHTGSFSTGAWCVHPATFSTEYVRGDIHEALAARVVVLEAALNEIADKNQERFWEQYQWIVRDGPYAKIARFALSPKQPTPATQVEQIADLVPGTFAYAEAVHTDMTDPNPKQGETAEEARARRDYYRGYDDDGLPSD